MSERTDAPAGMGTAPGGATMALRAGTRIDGTQKGQYEVLSVLGIGGFAITYLAQDHLLGGRVAVKEYCPATLALRLPLSDVVAPRHPGAAEAFQLGLQRFREEARTLRQFRAPGIVRVEAFVEANGTGYLVMEYEEGMTLAQWLAALPAPPDEAQLQALFRPLFTALLPLHAAGFLHRDIKPANIYLCNDGRPLLLDFGAARHALGTHDRTLTRFVSDGYAPFEQYAEHATVTPATDLYGMGATLYRCMTGLDPVPAADRIHALHGGAADPLVPARVRCAGRYSEALLDVVDAMLAPRAADRPASADEVLARWSVHAHAHAHEHAPAAARIEPAPTRAITPPLSEPPADATRALPGNVRAPQATPPQSSPALPSAPPPANAAAAGTQPHTRPLAPAPRMGWWSTVVNVFALIGTLMILAGTWAWFMRPDFDDAMAQLQGTHGEAKDVEAAREEFEALVAREDPRGHYGLALLLWRGGSSLGHDAAQAYTHASTAASAGFTPAAGLQSEMLDDNTSFPDWMSPVRGEARKAEAHALRRTALGAICELAPGSELARLANDGHPVAQAQVATLLIPAMSDNGCQRGAQFAPQFAALDARVAAGETEQAQRGERKHILLSMMYAPSLEWIRKAARADDPAALLALSDLGEDYPDFVRGKGAAATAETAPDYKAMRARAQALGYVKALYAGSSDVSSGDLKSSRTDYAKWIERLPFVERAAEQGYYPARQFLASAALACFTTADRNDVLVVRHCGDLARLNTRVARWVATYAERGDPDSQYILGILTRDGMFGISQDTAAGVEWLRKAAAAGNWRATDVLRERGLTP